VTARRHVPAQQLLNRLPGALYTAATASLWNSEHLAYWYGTPSQVIKVPQNGYDFDIVTYTARPLWGLLGEHSCTD
jgi:hypothetical protein